MSSRDGSVLAAIESENLWVSLNEGYDWTRRILPDGLSPDPLSGLFGEILYSLAMSSDGRQMIAGGYAKGSIWLSSDVGATWSRAPFQEYYNTDDAGSITTGFSSFSACPDPTPETPPTLPPEPVVTCSNATYYPNGYSRYDMFNIYGDDFDPTPSMNQVVFQSPNGNVTGEVINVYTKEKENRPPNNRVGYRLEVNITKPITVTGPLEAIVIAFDVASAPAQVATVIMTPEFWRTVASSADGTKLAAASYPLFEFDEDIDSAWLSSDSGKTWNHQIGQGKPNRANYVALASSGDGRTVAACPEFNFLRPTTVNAAWLTNDNGILWTVPKTGLPGNQTFGSIAMSADGKRLAAVTGSFCLLPCNTNSVWLFKDGNWTSPVGSPSQVTLNAIAMSSDGEKLVVGGNDQLWTSDDFGVTWVLR